MDCGTHSRKSWSLHRKADRTPWLSKTSATLYYSTTISQASDLPLIASTMEQTKNNGANQSRCNCLVVQFAWASFFEPTAANHPTPVFVRQEIPQSLQSKTLVIDEADEMLSQGFKEQMYKIFHVMPDNIQIGLFSATMPRINDIIAAIIKL